MLHGDAACPQVVKLSGGIHSADESSNNIKGGQMAAFDVCRSIAQTAG
jgi:hypothetical protein